MATVDWTREENEAAIHTYFSMWQKSFEGIGYNKTAFYRELSSQYPNRNEGSFENRMQNISFVFSELNIPFVPGLKPRPHRPGPLLDLVANLLDEAELLSTLRFGRFSPSELREVELSSFIGQESTKEKTVKIRPPRDYAQLARIQAEIGVRGEQLVFESECEELRANGNSDLAKNVEWVSKINEAAGFDILSFSPDGTERYLEVKTTTFGEQTPFYVSKNEWEFAKSNKNFELHRIFELLDKPGRWRKLQPAFLQLDFEPIQFKVRVC